ncbi:MAG: hypothetical protein IT373_02960 [Polyangiaceae bacterium]|nr:hypothetical protein [Polyangiaceae bacterium]
MCGVGGNSTITIHGNQDEHIDGPVYEDYGAGQRTTVTGDHQLVVTGSQDIDVCGSRNEHVVGAVNESFLGGRGTTVDGDDKLTVLGAGVRNIVGPLTESVTAAVTQTYSAAQTFTVAGAQVQTISGPQTTTVGGPATHTYGGPLTETIGGARTCIASGPIVNVAPSITNLEPAHQATHGFWDKTFGFQTTAGNMAINRIAFKLDFTGLAVSILPVKIELVGFYAKNRGINLATMSADLRNKGLMNVLAGLINMV